MDPVVRLAVARPVPDGRAERDRHPVERQLPLRGCERGRDFQPAIAEALVHRARELDRNVEHTVLELLRAMADELVLQRGSTRR